MKKLLQLEHTSWIHLVNPTHHEIDEIVEKYNLHEIIEEDLKEKNTQDKIDVYDDYIFLILHFPKYHTQDKKHYANEFNIILSKDFIISFSKHPTVTIEKIRNQYLEDIKDIDEDIELRTSPYYISYKILDALYDKTLIGLSKFNRNMMSLEEKIFEGSIMNQDLLGYLLRKSRNITFLKNLFSPHEEIIEELNKATIKLHQGDLDVYFEDLQYKVDKVNNTIKAYIENTESLSNKYNTLVTLKTNSVITILTITTVIVGFMTLITGFYGMNVRLPGQEFPYSRILLVIIMLSLGAFMLVLFKKKKWM